MISNYDNCLFIHIPKTAGQSIETVFLERAGLNWENRASFLLKPNNDPSKGPPRLSHLTAREYLSLGYISSEAFDAMYKFTVVRNPWDRLVSEYSYQKYPYSFKRFIFEYFPVPGQDNYEKNHGHYRHVMPQVEFVCDEHGELMVDSVVKFESLQKDFNEVAKAITGEAITLPHKNSTYANPVVATLKRLVAKKPAKKVDFREFYDNETKAWVAEYYADDIKTFGYQFDPD